MQGMGIRAGVLWLALRAIGLLPLAWLQALGSGLGWLARRLDTREARVARRNLALCFPDLPATERERLWRENLAETGRTLTETLRFWTRPARVNLREVIEVRGEGALDEALASGRGIIIAAPHLGNWELLNQWLASRSPLAIVYRPARREWLDAVIRRGRAQPGVSQIPAEAAGVRALFKRLRAGGMVGILPDQQPKRGDGVFVPFFGIQALSMSLVSRLANKTGAVVLMAFVERGHDLGGFRVHLRAAPEAVADADTMRAVAALNAAVEACIAQAPAQYQWSYKRFSMRPEGEPPMGY